MRKLCFCAVLCTLLIGCENAAIEELRDTTFENGIPSRVDASLEGDTTRIELDAELQTVWTADDAVSVFYRTTANNLFRFAWATGDESGTLIRETAYAGDTAIDEIVSLYPYSDAYVLDPATSTIEVEIEFQSEHSGVNFCYIFIVATGVGFLSIILTQVVGAVGRVHPLLALSHNLLTPPRHTLNFWQPICRKM